MDSLRWLLGLKPVRVQPAKVKTDEVFPAHFFDDTKTFRSIVMSWTLRFDDVLDADMLNRALSQLLQIGDWRKLGGRLRLTENGDLEIHVPKEFTPERPAIRFSHQVFETKIREHPLASQLPKATAGPSVQSDLTKFRLFAARENAPITFEDFIYSNEPQISLHITSFKDATLVALLWPHTMTSALGRAELVKAWGLVLAGRDDEVPPFQGAREDALDGVGAVSDLNQEVSVLEPNRLSGFNMLRFGLNFAWDLAFGPSMQTKMLYLPPEFVPRIRQNATNDLKAISEFVEPAFISEGDALTAWATKMVAKTQGSRPILVINAVDVRSRLKAVFQSGGVYVQNLAFATFTFFSANQVSNTTLGEIAHKFRKDILDQITDPQIRTLMRGMRAAGKTGTPPMYGEPNSRMMIISNWTKANFFNIIDFSPAVIGSFPVDKKSHRQGRMVYQQSQVMVISPMARRVFNILGKDSQGGYWVTGIFPAAWWREVEKEISHN